MKYCFGLTLLCSVFACSTAKSSVDAASREFDAAQQTGNRAMLERYLAEDLVFIRGSGAVADRESFIAAFTDPKTRFDPFVIKNRVLIPLGDRAVIVAGEGTISGTSDGTRFAEHLRYADVFELRDGQWRVVYVQVTMLKAP
jgi:ketosteroid isomerase-like protein